MKRLWLALLVFTMGTNLSVPLFPIYETQFHMSSAGITLLFSIYVVGLLPALLVIGPLSDHVGRKIILIPSMLIMTFASVVFAADHNLTELFIARALQGIGIGAFLGTCTAAMVDHSGEGRNPTLQLASFTTMVGFGLGPATTGLVLQFASSWRCQIPYVLHILLMAAALLGVWTVRESRETGDKVRLDIRIAIPKTARTWFFLFVGPAGLLFFAFNGTVIALLPSFSSQVLHVTNDVIVGGLIFLMMISGGVSQLLSQRARSIPVTRLGLVLTVVGAFVILWSGAVHSPTLMVVATVVEGAGNGLAFKGGLGLAGTIGGVETRAQVISSYYLAAYAGFSVPVYIGGLLSTYFGLIHGLLVLVTVLSLFTALILLNQRFFLSEPTL